MAGDPGGGDPGSGDPGGGDPGDDDGGGGSRRGALVVLVLMAVLVAATVFVMGRIHSASQLQDCVAAGRRNCAPVESPPR
ncbi:MAG: hypothetical protein JSR21_17480 [Proteobacteria bacterium]|nr:hypothetical protein [Pseudomonadota bacterium]